jgi:methionyl aminopeptidase
MNLKPSPDNTIVLKSRREIAIMREAGVIVADVIRTLAEQTEPGMTTKDLDQIAARMFKDSGAESTALGYFGYPGHICVSVNDEVVHGIPGPRVLAAGDVVSGDCGAVVDGWHADAALTFTLGPADPAVAALLEASEEALWQGIAQVRAGSRVGDVSAAVQRSLEAATGSGCRYGIVRDYTGHGIGSALHQPPDVPNTGRPGSGPRIVEGTVLAVEPMVVLGDPDTVTAEDEWTVLSADGSLAAHFEHTVAVTATGSWVLTAADGGRARLAALGVPFGGS